MMAEQGTESAAPASGDGAGDEAVDNSWAEAPPQGDESRRSSPP